MGVLAAALAPGSPDLVDEAHVVIVELDNASMAFESVSHAQLLGGANRAMIGGELIQFQLAEPLSPTLWRLSRLLRGRAGTACDSDHAAGAPFLSLDDAGALMLPEDLAGWAASAAARVQWPSATMWRSPSLPFRQAGRRSSDARRVGKECVSTCRSRWSRSHLKKKKILNT